MAQNVKINGVNYSDVPGVQLPKTTGGSALFLDADEYVKKTTDIVNDLESTATDKALAANQGKVLYEYIQNLQSVGRFLAIWNASTGLPTSEPASTPYAYKTGDYFRVGQVGTINYKPTGSSYTGAASTVQETEKVAIGDVYYYDGSVWLMQKSSGGGTVQDVQVNGTSVLSGGIANIPLAGTSVNGVMSSSDKSKLDNIENVYRTAVAQDAIDDTKQNVLSEGTGISISSDTVSIVQSDSESQLNAELIGSPTVTDDYIVSGFDSSNYLSIPKSFSPTESDWEVMVKIKLAAYGSKCRFFVSATTDPVGFAIGTSDTSGKYSIWLRPYGSSAFVMQASSNTLSLNTWYWIRTRRVGTTYQVHSSQTGAFAGEEILGIEVKNSIKVIQYSTNMLIGAFETWSNDFTIDMSQTYVKIGDMLYWEGYSSLKQAAKATTDLYGLVKPDGTTININNGVISVDGLSNKVDKGTTSSAVSPATDSQGGHTHSVTVPTVSKTSSKLSVITLKKGSASKATAGTAIAVAKTGTAVSIPNVTGNSSVTATKIETPQVVSVTPAVNMTTGKPTRTVFGTATTASKVSITAKTASKATAGTAVVYGNADVGTAVTVGTALGGTTTFVTSAINSASLTDDTAATPDYAFNTDAIKSASLTGTTIFNTNAIKSAVLGGTTTFNTDAIKSAELDIVSSSTSGYAPYVSEATAPSLGGTTSFNTDAIKSATLGGTTSFNTDAIKSATMTTSYDATTKCLTLNIDTAAASKSSVTISTTAATKASVTLSGGTHTTKYMKVNTAPASTGTVTIATTAADSGTIGISTVAATKKGIKVSTTSAETGSVSLTTKSITPAKSADTTRKITPYTFEDVACSAVSASDVTVPVVSSNADVTVAQAGTAVTGIIKSGATTPAVENVTATNTSLGTAISVTPAVSNGTVTPYTFSDVNVASIDENTDVATGGVSSTGAGAEVVTSVTTGTTTATSSSNGAHTHTVNSHSHTIN